MKIKLTPNAVRLAEVARSKQDVRHYLLGFLVESESGRVVATDGHRMVLCNEAATFSGKAKDDWIITPAQKVTVPKKIEEIVVDTKTGVMAMYDQPVSLKELSNYGAAVKTVPVDCVINGKDTTYPDYNRVIDGFKPTAAEVVSFNVTLFSELQQAIGAIGLKLHLGGENSVTWAQPGDGGKGFPDYKPEDFRFYVMPMRL